MFPSLFSAGRVMQPQLLRIGASRSPVVTIDGFVESVAPLVEIAAAMAPFPSAAGTYYPGLRRAIGEADGAAWDEVGRILDGPAPFLGGGFDFARFDLIEASFSLVTTPPAALQPAQRAPHFDSTDPFYLALLLYLSETPGTAFYRQRSTGIEKVDDAGFARFVEAAKREGAALTGYTAGSNGHFEQVAAIAGRPGRMAIYQGCLLHSGIIPDGHDFSDDPRRGRLTLNLFVRGHR